MSTDRERKFLITGGTGFLGSYLFTELLKKGYEVTLICRPRNGKSAQERIENIIEWFKMNSSKLPGLKVYEGYIDKEGLGLSPSEREIIARDITEVIHCASETDFSERNRKHIETVNIGFLNNVLNYANDSKAAHFHYLSTAYSAGSAEGECAEEINIPSGFTNVYEETKNRAEKLADSFCRDKGMRLTIYRPSIVYGESGTGRSRKFNAFYYPVKALSYIKEIMLKDIKEKNGTRAAALGVSLKDNGTLVMPIRFRSIYGGSLNLIPVDFFAEAMITLIQERDREGIYHLVSGSPGNIEELICYTSKYFNIEGLSVTFGEQISDRTGLEDLFESYIRMYLPYIADKRKFLTFRADPILRGRNIICPRMSYEIFERCIDYAIKCGWGKIYDKFRLF
ncbi:MAG TPA: SDR family oxidoreductase [Clostridiales bacterium]|jgi:nucleoside-diphosphate-sugar epimerase|nr:SDR family oxidoreductase [Clostridiales bacterium]HQP69870.1 SDR family oxidoreductase [Clostridiales bacterium]